MNPEIIMYKGRKCFAVPIEQFERMKIQADLPSLPAANANGNYDAIEYARASIARTLISGRREAGLSQDDLARLSGVRRETISRIESGKHTATVAIIDKLDKAIRSMAKRKRKAIRQPIGRK
jgi:DNA-binding XRE family transcriptional regulator